MIDDGRYIGQRISQYRRLRGWSQKELADHVGDISRGAIAKYETGERPVDSRALIYSLAQALSVSVADLTGQLEDGQTTPQIAAFRAAMPAIEAAFMTAGQVDGAATPAPVAALAAQAERAAALRVASDYGELGKLLPGLITGLYRRTQTGSEAERAAAWDALARTAFTTALETKGAGNTSLAWIAAQATRQAAAMVGSPAHDAAAGYAHSQVLLATPGSITAALTSSTSSLNALEPHLNSAGALEMYGMLHLQAALSAAALSKDAGDHLREAADTAERVKPAASSAFALQFGRENATIWHMSVAVEERDGGAAIEQAKTIAPQNIPTESRQSQYFIELGRAHALENNYTASMHALLRAEHIAPQKVRNRTVVRELVGYMLRKAQRDLISGDLGKLAKRVGAVA